MNQEISGNMGQLICELRKAGHMTQKELAEKLHITDKAVSKWERGLSCPDIALLPALADVLGVTAGELLSGIKPEHQPDAPGTVQTAHEVEDVVGNTLQYADTTARNRIKALHNVMALAFSLLLLAGIVVCAICDLAIAGAFTWSLFPISSIIFAWLAVFPAIKWGSKGIWGTMAALSVLIWPYLLVLNSLLGDIPLFLSIGVPMAAVAVVFLWVVFLLFLCLKRRRRLAAAVSLLLVIPTNLVINFILSHRIGEPLMDVWDILTFSIVGIAAAVLFIIDAAGRRKA